ncbi:DUF916 and DUF3324 domain-containing protein [Enterococcus sp. JM9B]|uniref:DUF916 and DUF3324 domain-containing protein n=1 Tax=Enterococcus sp. JM9B TaxID=1857216 RepID=UPI0013749885|nr:DUF916 and DUF3324 domain-containing protein [Enterococcus sp. JM9B]KAF1303369.1 hypothetical protein BAU16_04770 [Enterococcus sp. JM9B]
MHKRLKFILLGMALLIFSFFPMKASAATGAGFTIEGVFPENQQADSTFFDLLVKPDTQQDVTMNIISESDKDIKVKISPNPSFTNQLGVIDYSQADFPKDSSAKYTIPELISKPQTITLKAGETNPVTFQLKVPKEKFEGMILGAFFAEQEADEEEEKQTGITNRYQLSFGIALRESLDYITPELKLNQVKPAVYQSLPAVFANLQNIKGQAFGNMSVDAKIYKSGSKEVFMEAKADKQEMAPNSNYDFPISWGKNNLEAGDYHLSLVAKSGKKTWKFEKDFSIVSSDANEINKEASALPEPNYLWLYILIAVLLLILLLLLAFLLGRRKRKEEEKENSQTNQGD